MAVFINIMVSFRDFFIHDLIKEEPDSPMTLAISLCKGIGFIVLGNMYDNVKQPKKLTFILLIIISIFTVLVISLINML